MKEEILKKLQEVVKNITDEDVHIDISIPKDISKGDFTTNVAFQLGKLSGKNPLEMAEEITTEFNTVISSSKNEKSNNVIPAKAGIQKSNEWIPDQVRDDTLFFLAKVEAVQPGFINFYLSTDALSKNLAQVLKSPEKVATTRKMEKRRVIIEFTDPNPFKEFHIGHVYTNTVGEAMSRLYEANGAVVERADYFGDV